jgi:hypothetical protein
VYDECVKRDDVICVLQWPSRYSGLGFIQKSTFEKTGFQIPAFPKKPVFEFLQKM